MSDRCPTCDREGCPMIPGNPWPPVAVQAECVRNRVDWRDRAFRAESVVKAVQRWKRLIGSCQEDDALSGVWSAAENYDCDNARGRK